MKWDLQQDFLSDADVWVSLDWEIREEVPAHFSVWHNWGGRTILHKEFKTLAEAMKYVAREVKKRKARV
jgi:hypothetical protein